MTANKKGKTCSHRPGGAREGGRDPSELRLWARDLENAATRLMHKLHNLHNALRTMHNRKPFPGSELRDKTAQKTPPTKPSMHMHTLRWLLAIPTLLLAIPGPLPAVNPPAKKPNVVFLFADDQRADTIGALGNPHI